MRGRILFSLSLLGGLLATRLVAAPADAPAAVRLPDLVRTKQTVFAIPFQLPENRDADAAARRVVLGVSTDLGVTWQPAGEVAPSAGSFSFRAPKDGEYWFRIRVVDAKGRSRGGAGPDMRVLVDAAGPRIAARVWKGADGEIICRYAATDDSLRLDSLKVEYRAAVDSGWKPIAAEGILSREVPAHMVGEDIWWAGEKVESLVVRISIADSSGNQAVRQFTMEASDPKIDQAALASELGVPPLPSGAPPVTALSSMTPDGPMTATPFPSMTTSVDRGAWAPEPAAADPTVSGRVNRFVSRDPMAGAAVGADDALAAARATAAGAAEYRGRPLQMSRSRRFAWEYDVQHDGSTARGLRVELWSTRDGGVTWQRSGIDTDGTSPIEVSLPAAGLYGFRLEIAAEATAATGPRSGESPETWVVVDDEPPQVEVSHAGPAADEPGVVLIRYACRDQLIAPRSARLSFSPHPAGPWSTLAEGIDCEGTHRWQPDRATPPRVYIRVDVSDVAGNVGHAVTPEPVALSGRVTGRLGGLRELPAAGGAARVP